MRKTETKTFLLLNNKKQQATMEVAAAYVKEKKRFGEWSVKIHKALESSDGKPKWMSGSSWEDLKMIENSHGSTIVVAHHPKTQATTLCFAVGNLIAKRKPGDKRVDIKVGSHVVGGSNQKTFYALVFKAPSKAEEFKRLWDERVRQFEESKRHGGGNGGENNPSSANCDSKVCISDMCGLSIPGDANFCPVCGVKQPKEEESKSIIYPEQSQTISWISNSDAVKDYNKNALNTNLGGLTEGDEEENA